MASLKGKAAIVGIGEVPTQRVNPNRTMYGLCAEAAKLAIEDAGLNKDDINGLVTDGGYGAPATMAEYIGIRPTFATSGMPVELLQLRWLLWQSMAVCAIRFWW